MVHLHNKASGKLIPILGEGTFTLTIEFFLFDMESLDLT